MHIHKRKPNIEYQGQSNIATRNYCPICGFTFHSSYESDLHTVKEIIWENYCPVCGYEIDKRDLQERINNVLKTGKDDLADDILRD